MKVIAVVVTYNRLPLLKRNIACLRIVRSLTSIVVVNNGSTDGTSEWLAEQENISIINQSNSGGAGGFRTGISYAYDNGADYIWCMDDDVFPREDCLEQLLTQTKNKDVGIIAPRRIRAGHIYTNDFQRYNLTNPFASLYQERLARKNINEPTDIVGTAFEGPLIKRAVVETVGLPNEQLFIFCDDTDYCLRTTMVGFRIVYVPTALMDKEAFFTEGSWAERNKKKKWKRFYQVRNSTYLNHHYGKNIAVRYLRGFNCVMGYILIAIVTCPFSKAWQLRDIPKLWKAYNDGINEYLGKM